MTSGDAAVAGFTPANSGTCAAARYPGRAARPRWARSPRPSSVAERAIAHLIKASSIVEQSGLDELHGEHSPVVDVSYGGVLVFRDPDSIQLAGRGHKVSMRKSLTKLGGHSRVRARAWACGQLASAAGFPGLGVTSVGWKLSSLLGASVRLLLLQDGLVR